MATIEVEVTTTEVAEETIVVTTVVATEIETPATNNQMMINSSD